MTEQSLVVTIGGREIRISSGAIARQANGSVLIEDGDTVLLATATADRAASRADFLPLTTEYRLRYSSAGRIPGSYDRREAKPTDFETLTSRLIDRCIRPFFPDDWRHETQVIVQPLSFDPTSDIGVLGILAASAALLVSDIPWQGPVLGLRFGLRGGLVVADPTSDEISGGGLDMMVAMRGDGIVMVEGGAAEIDEARLLECFALARTTAEAPLAALSGLQAAKTTTESGSTKPAVDFKLAERVREMATMELGTVLQLADKQARGQARRDAKHRVVANLRQEWGDASAADIEREYENVEYHTIRARVLAGTRLDGRSAADVRPISGRVGWLKRCHGSSLFTRGETQAIVTCTLGSERDAKSTDALEGRVTERFLLHYSFPAFSVGETRPLRGPGRREIGHGYLARRALLSMLPRDAELPYTVRLESLITESNGSSSMATVCGGTLALIDAGVEIARPVAGIAMGMVSEGEKFVVLSDILGDEDHVGDMDFKVCGTELGVTAIQLDSKLGALPDEVMRTALEQAKAGRLHILAVMAPLIAEARANQKQSVPRTATVQIETNRIGTLVGSGGKTIKGIQSDHGVSVEVNQEGLVRVFGSGDDRITRALERVNELTGVPHLGEPITGKVVSVQSFGTFVRLFEGVEALLPDVALEIGSDVKVRVTAVNHRGKLELSRA